MKVAILTQPICNNYGGILQNYALQTVLERRGHTVITLNYPAEGGYKGSPARHLMNTCRRMLQKVKGDPSIIWVDLDKESRKQVELAILQKSFLDKHLHLHTIYSPIDWKQIEDFGFDAFVVGSDQVWRPRYNRGHLGNLFLDFTEGKDVKRIAYAASLGTDEWEYDALQTVQCAALAKQFGAVSVRESSGVILCKNYLDVDAIHVLDPTLMLNAEDYIGLCSGDEHPQGDYIAVYLLDYTKEKMALLNEVSHQLNCPVHIIGRFSKAGYPSMESWLEGIAYAKYVITDSFHGTVFSIIFRKQFVTLGNVARGNSRFTSLFATIGIAEERQCGGAADVIYLLKGAIDYDKVNMLIADNKAVSTRFLVDAGL